HSLAALDVHADVMCLDKLLDGVSQLATPPVFQAMDLAAITGDGRLIALDHGGHLLALIGMHNEHYFVVTHKTLLVDVLRLCDGRKGQPVRCMAGWPHLTRKCARIEQETSY